MSGIPLFESAAGRGDAIAVIDASGAHTYDRVERRSRARAAQLLGDRDDLEEARVCFLAEPGMEYVVTQWAIWRAGGIAVPLSPHHPIPELERIIDDCGASTLIAANGLDQRLRPIAEARDLAFRAIPRGGYDLTPILRVVTKEEIEGAVVAESPVLPELDRSRRAMILYTSGTTGRPKGVVTTHAALDAQMRAMVEAWRWTETDRILHVLPLQHTHGIVNALGCALYAGAAVEFAGPFDGSFDEAAVWDRLASGDVTVFMAVPTIYVRLLRALEGSDEFTRARRVRGARRLRLAVSGSAALPVSTFERWEKVTGQRLLERYGMTEIGMGLSNPYEGERRAGTVGQPLPGVDIRLVSPDSGRLLAEGTEPREIEPGGGDAASGEIQVRGEMLFREYWGLPEETAAAFTDGWFRTGDEAVLEDGYYRLLGRRAVDILKSGGYKISAIEIEELLRAHPGVADCAVVGLPDEEWGERIAAAVVTEPNAWFIPDSSPKAIGMIEERASAIATVLEPWLRDRIAPYKVPRTWLWVEDLPRNEMGKVRKPAVRELFGPVAEAP